MDRRSKVMRFYLFVVIVTGWIGSSVCVSRVKLVDNGYTDLVVAITEEAPYYLSEIIIENIKEIIREASPVLYKATDNQVYFRSVKILIPASWTSIEASSSSWETVDTADVLIGTSNPKHGNTPYTKQPGGCGEPGELIHLTQNYVVTIGEQQNFNEFGKPGKVFVHEWAHYRYGVFDEYGSPGDPDFPLFYRPLGSTKILPNICANAPLINFRIEDISNNSTNCKIDPVTNLYDHNCRFIFPDDFKPTSSLTSYHQFDSVVHFCKDGSDDTHMYYLPNKHNKMCNGKSVWSVIEKHPDFADRITKRFDILPVSFQIVRPETMEGDQMTTVPVDVNSEEEEPTAVAVVVAVIVSLMVISVCVALVTIFVKRLASKRKTYIAVPVKTGSPV